MDTSATSDLQEKTEIVHQIGACLYYHVNGTDKQFEILTYNEQEPWLKMAMVVLQHLDKMDLVLVPRVRWQATEAKKPIDIIKLTELITKFTKKLNTTKPALFPNEELAHRILEREET